MLEALGFPGFFFFVKVVLGSWDDSRPCFSVFIAWLGLTVDTPASVYGLFRLRFSRFLRVGDSVAELPEQSRKVWLHCETIFGECFLSASLARRWMPVCVTHTFFVKVDVEIRTFSAPLVSGYSVRCLRLRSKDNFEASRCPTSLLDIISTCPSYQVATCVVSRSPEEYKKFLFLLGDGSRKIICILYVWFDTGYSSCVRHAGL